VAGLTAAAGMLVWIVYGSDIVSGRVTTYYAACLKWSPDSRCAAVGRTFDPAVFRVSVPLQQVESVGADGLPVRLHACAVLSRSDWHCRSSADDGFELGYHGGRPWMRVHGEPASDLVFLPRWQYLWLRSGEPQRERLPTLFQFR
jgi:hypothetical protein